MRQRRAPRVASRPSQRAIRNVMAFWGGGTEMEAGKKTGRQKESLVNDEISEWRATRPNVLLKRNLRRLVELPNGRKVMYGWGAVNGSDSTPDWVGYASFVITPAMVGLPIAVFLGAESKRPATASDRGGVVSDEQEIFLNSLKDAGGIACVARSADDIEQAMAQWLLRRAGA